MITGTKEYLDRNEKLVGFADASDCYPQFVLRCACEGIEPWSPGMFEIYKKTREPDDALDVWKALAE